MAFHLGKRLCFFRPDFAAQGQIGGSGVKPSDRTDCAIHPVLETDGGMKARKARLPKLQQTFHLRATPAADHARYARLWLISGRGVIGPDARGGRDGAEQRRQGG